ncbi:MAG TPA: neutral/alkaline non-lysosomal ceramidase N-terminal domain-containing protein [Fimbriimonadales bacterium]|nr:neutral/alkaline non-lysosomal ceramidase N-terminal domain-containing protein [Fimbriimonadales bacterium]
MLIGTCGLFAILTTNSPAIDITPTQSTSSGDVRIVKESLQVSYSVTDITPPVPLPLGGYTQRQDKTMEGVQDRLYARCLILRKGAKEVALVSMESLTVPGGFAKEVEKGIKQRGFQGTLFLTATHTHCAPDSQMLNERMKRKLPGIAAYDPTWRKWYADKIIECVSNAKEFTDVQSVTLYSGKAKLNHPRVIERKADSTLTRLRFRTKENHYELLHYAAHPTIYSEKMNFTSGDWCGIWTAMSSNRIFFNGAMGDIAPSPPNGKTEAERVKNTAEALENTPVESKIRLNSADLNIFVEPVNLPAPIPHPEFAKRYNVPDALAKILVNEFAEREAQVIIVRYGEIALIGIPGEPTAEVGIHIQKIANKKGIRYPIVVSFCNAWLGYILTDEEYHKGGYEATLSFYGDGLAECILQTVEKAI